MELHDSRNIASAMQSIPPNSIKLAGVALLKDRLCELCIPKAGRVRSWNSLRDEDHNDYNQEQRDKADGYHLFGLLHILHDVIREGIELCIGHALVAIPTH